MIYRSSSGHVFFLNQVNGILHRIQIFLWSDCSRYSLLILVAVCYSSLSFAQVQDTMNLGIIKPGDEFFPRLIKKIGSSPFPANPICEENRPMPNNSSGHTIFHYNLNLTYSTSVDSATTLGGFKILLDEAGENLLFAREGNLYESDKWQKFKDERLLTSFQFGVHAVYVELRVQDINLIRSCQLGGINFKLLSVYYSQLPNVFGKKSVLIKDDVTGVQFYVDSMYIGNTRMKSVTLGESFRFQEDWYRFIEFSPHENILILELLAKDHRPIGYREGFYVNRVAMLEQLGLSPDNKQKIALYFWGAWCYPCVQYFPSTLSLYQQAAKEKGIYTCFVSYDDAEKDYSKTDAFLQQYELGDVRIKSTFGNDLHAIEKFISSQSLLAQLKIHSFPSYVLIAEDGQILFNNTKQEGLRELMGL